MPIAVVLKLVVLIGVFFFAESLWSATSNVGPQTSDPADYGVDVSFPIHRYMKGSSYFKTQYEKMMSGCYAKYSKRQCDSNEMARMEMNLQQPKSQHNYTEMGFKKLRVPAAAWEPLIDFYNRNKHKEKLESWPPGNTYTNNWDAPSYMISFEDRSLRGGLDIKQQIWDGVKPIIEEWTGKKIKPTSLYGIRSYKRGAILSPHVDRMPLVSSCIINVDQDVEEPWPAEVYSHAGKAYNVTMQPGDMVLYESHTVLHGRPFPLKGNYFANIFVHFIPLDHFEENDRDPALHKSDDKGRGWFNPPKTSNTQGGHEQGNHDEDTVKKHMASIDRRNEGMEPSDADNEDKEYSGVEEDEDKEYPGVEYGEGDGRTALHEAAGLGDLKKVRGLVQMQSSDMIHVRDVNDWQPVHEAARGGHTEVLRLLIDMGADIGAKTKHGGTPLWWARRLLAPGHATIEYLEEIGAPEEGDDL